VPASRVVLRRRRAIAEAQAQAAQEQADLLRSQNWEAWLVRAAEIVVDVWMEQYEHPGKRIRTMHMGEL
jgi:hypothetical protein